MERKKKENLAKALNLYAEGTIDLILRGVAPQLRFLVHVMRGRRHDTRGETAPGQGVVTRFPDTKHARAHHSTGGTLGLEQIGDKGHR